MPQEHATRQTFRNELWRSLPSGVLDAMSSTFGMLIAVRVFHLGHVEKSIFLSATSGGLITSLFVVPLLLKARFSRIHPGFSSSGLALGCFVFRCRSRC
jgi:hypothetical protein